MKKQFTLILLILTCSARAQTIISVSQFFATAGDYFSITVEMSGTPSNPYNIKLVSTVGTITPWSSYNTTGNFYNCAYLLRDYEKVGNYFVTYGSSTYPTPVRINRLLAAEKFSYLSVTAPNIPVSTGALDGISYMQADALGNLYCVGTFTGTCTIDGQSVTASGARDGFIAKFNNSGSLVWIRKVGSSIDDNFSVLEGLNSVEIFRDSVIYVTGYVRCDTTLKFNGSVPLIFPSRNIGSPDGVVMKLDSSGNFAWSAFQGSIRNDATNDVVVDTNGSVYVTGYAQSEASSSSGPSDSSFTYVYNLDATDSIGMSAYGNDQYGLFVACYSSSGQLVWARRQSLDYFSYGSFPVRMKRCSDNSLVILTKGSGTLKWGGTACSNGSCCNPHYALIKLDSQGNRLWCLEDGNFVDYMDVGIDALDNIYVTTPTSWIGGDDETFLRKYTSAGTPVWSVPVQHNKNNNGNYVSVTDAAGNTYVSHAYQNLWATSGNVIVTKKFDSNGQLLSFTCPEPVVPYDENKPTAITLSSSGDQIFLAGHFRGSQRFGTTTLNSATRKAFLVTMQNCPVSYDSISVTSCGPYLSPGGNHLYNSSGYYADTLTNAANCDSIILITLNSNAIPTVNITAQGLTTFCQGDSVLLTATPGLPFYQWYNRSWMIPGATSSSYTAKSQGRYYCIGQNAAMCPDTSNNIFIYVPCVPIGPDVDKIPSKDSDNEIEIFPNPGNGIFTISGVEGELTVYDFLGRSLFSMRGIKANESINLTEFQDGIYLVCIRNREKVYVKRIQLVK